MTKKQQKHLMYGVGALILAYIIYKYVQKKKNVNAVAAPVNSIPRTAVAAADDLVVSQDDVPVVTDSADLDTDNVLTLQTRTAFDSVMPAKYEVGDYCSINGQDGTWAPGPGGTKVCQVKASVAKDNY